ncbi:MAG: hypothetical protein ABFD96_01850 [Armatimonadia bacterium]
MWRVWLVLAAGAMVGLVTQPPDSVPDATQQQVAQADRQVACQMAPSTYCSAADLGAAVWNENLPPPVPVGSQSLLWRLRADEYGSYRRMLQ